MIGLLGGLAVNAAATPLNYWLAEKHASEAQKRQLDLMHEQSKLNQSAQINAASNMVQGMKMAGLNPAMAGQQPSSAQSVGLGSAPKGENVEFSPSDLLTFAQIENLNAQTNKTKEEADQVHKVNEITDTSNNAAKATYLEHIDRQIADLTEEASKLPKGSNEYGRLMDRIDQLNASKERVNDSHFVGALGIAQGIRSGADSVKADFDVVNSYLNGRLDKKVLLKKNMDEGVVDSIASLPKFQKEHLAQSIEQIKQAIAESESKEDLNDQTVLKIQKEIQSIGNEILHRNLNDPVWIRTNLGVNSEEWKAWTDQQWRDNAFRVGSSVLQGIATGGALGAVNKMLNSAPRSSLKDSGPHYPFHSNTNPNTYGVGNFKF